MTLLLASAPSRTLPREGFRPSSTEEVWPFDQPGRASEALARTAVLPAVCARWHTREEPRHTERDPSREGSPPRRVDECVRRGLHSVSDRLARPRRTSRVRDGAKISLKNHRSSRAFRAHARSSSLSRARRALRHESRATAAAPHTRQGDRRRAPFYPCVWCGTSAGRAARVSLGGARLFAAASSLYRGALRLPARARALRLPELELQGARGSSPRSL